MTCMTDLCGNNTIARGLCNTCYYRFAQRVRRGTSKWGDLIAKGYCKKVKRSSVLTTAVRRKNALNAINSI